jgi:hypothetical protein
MEHRPKGETKKSDLIIIGLFVLGVLFFGAAKLVGQYVFILQAAGLIVLGAAVYIAVRYRLTQFVYTLSYDGDEEVFTVFRDRGRQKVPLCRLAVSYLRSVSRYAEREEVKKAAEGREIYYYTQSMSPSSFVLLLFESSGERDLAVIIECDTSFEKTLRSRQN